MSTMRHGNKIISDLSKAILFVIKRGAYNTDEVVDLLGSSYQEKEIRSRVSSLKYNSFLASGESAQLEVTTKGLNALNNIVFEAIRDHKPWDKHWRIVIYDIPESKRLARNRIRQLLKDLGFKQLQASVWVHPLPCLKQFQIIRKTYGIDQHLLLLEAADSEDFDKLRNAFSGQYPQLKSH